MKYNGIADAAARFVEKEQLKNRSLWKLTADQFANCPDDGILAGEGNTGGSLCVVHVRPTSIPGMKNYVKFSQSLWISFFLSGWGRQNFHIQQRSRIPGMGYVGQEICTYGADQLL
ncbi:MAG: hypothetical protein ACLURP_04200 [Ruminococcus sp.]